MATRAGDVLARTRARLEEQRTALRRGRDAARSGADGVLDVLHPLLAVGRGLGRLWSRGRRWWVSTPPDRRGPAVFLAAACLMALYLMPYGPLLALGALAAAAGWLGRDRPAPEPEEPAGPGEEEQARLQILYESLVPHFSLPEDPHPEPLYAPGGSWERAFEDVVFTPEGRVERLTLRYPPWVRDGDPEERARVEAVLSAKAGRGREYHFDWDTERNRLGVTVPAALPEDVCAQRFVTGPGEVLLGFTDEESVRRTVPVQDGAEIRDLPPLLWRTGPRASEPHLLALAAPGTGGTTLLRSVALQALRDGDVVVVDGGGAGEFACLAGRQGVLSVESTCQGALAALEWAAHETERRLLAARRPRPPQAAPEAVRPLWVLVDRPGVLTHLARAEGLRDPQEMLQVPLRHGRAAGVTVAVAEQFEGAEDLCQAVRAYTRARVVLGATSREQVRAVLGELPPGAPGPGVPAGRGWARLGGGPLVRLQVPATPDPYDEATAEAHREAVMDLLPDLWEPAQTPQAT